MCSLFVLINISSVIKKIDQHKPTEIIFLEKYFPIVSFLFSGNKQYKQEPFGIPQASTLSE